MVDVALAAAWIWAIAWLMRFLARKPPRHVWGEFNSADIANARRRSKGG